MISISHLTFQYEKRPIFQDCSFSLPNHALCFGENGSGKTTLLKLIAGILTPETGSISLDEKFDFKASILLNHRILLNDIDIWSHLNWIFETFHLSLSRRDEIMSEFELEVISRRKPAEMSDGERQWAALALATAFPADVYLLDEPLRSLDAVRTEKWLKILAKEMENGRSFVVTAHQIGALGDILQPFDMSSISESKSC